MFKIRPVKKNNGKITEAIVNGITWVIVHVFIRGTVRKLDNLISKEDKKELARLTIESDKAEKRLEELTNNMKTKLEIERKRQTKIESEKIATNKWEKQKKINGNKELERNDANKEINDEIVNRVLSKAIKDSAVERTQYKELKEKITYFIKAAKLIITIRKCSANLLSKELGLNKNNAYYILNKLEEAGIIVDIYGKRNQKLLIDDLEELEELLEVTDLNILFSEESIKEVE